MAIHKFKFRYINNLILIKATIFGRNRESEIECIVDTGAAITAVNVQAIDMLNYSARDGIKLSNAMTASGDRQHGYYIKVNNFLIGNLEHKDLIVDAVDLPNTVGKTSFDCLIGNNFLDKYNVGINYKTEEISFEELV